MRDNTRREAALKRGADELQDRLTWLLRNRSRALSFANRRYSAFCLLLYRCIEQAGRGQ